jgi:hypothetical protein
MKFEGRKPLSLRLRDTNNKLATSRELDKLLTSTHH